MAVKQHEIVRDNPGKMDLASLALHIQHLSEQLPYTQTPDLISWCRNVVIFLAHVQIPKDPVKHATFRTQIQQVEEFLQRLLSDIGSELRNDIVFGILKEVYFMISKPGSDASAASCVVLSVVQPNVISNAVNLLIRGGVEEEGDGTLLPTETGLRHALLSLCKWLCVWHTPVLGTWVLEFMKALQDSEKYEILVNVALEVIGQMFDALLIPAMRPLVSNIFLYILACMRNTTAAFEKIAIKVPSMLEGLASDSSPSSRPLLQNLVETFSALIEQHPSLKERHSQIVKYLDSHIKSNQCYLMDVPVWNITSSPHQSSDHVKVGLLNLGNTCYMNSVLQALLMTKQFSNGVVTTKVNLPVMCKLGSLFGMMMHSVRPCLNPLEFYVIAKPPNFLRDVQHDSSEFLGFLLDLLHEQERYTLLLSTDKPEYGESSQKSLEIVLADAPLSINECIDIKEIADDTPSGSSAGCSTSVSNPAGPSVMKATKAEKLKRSGSSDDDDEFDLVIKRKCTGIVTDENSPEVEKLLAHTIVQKTFGGKITTCVKCSKCEMSSYRKDVFRDLQLAFPDTQPSTKSHRDDSDFYSVQELVDFYCAVEHMAGDNMYYCQACDHLCEAERSITIEKAPSNLILVLKHFWYDPKTQIRAKLLHTVEHNQTIKIYEEKTPVQYELYAAVVHSGTQLDSGHYYTIARDGPQNWYKFNDHWVSRCSEQDLHNLSPPNTPYILFYKQVDSKSSRTSTNYIDSKKGEPPKSPIGTESTNEDGPSQGYVFNELEESLPLASLPAHLIEHILNDNKNYTSQHKRDTRNGRSLLKSNNRNYRDHDDDPPSSCGGTNDLLLNSNRYIY